MAHQITVRDDGVAETFNAGQTPWHRLGAVVEDAVTSDEALRLAHLDWTVKGCPVVCSATAQEIKGHQAIVRTDNEAVLGVVGARFRPLQNADAFAWLDALLGEKRAVFETAGSLRGGKLVWALVRLPTDLRVKGTDDVQKPYLLCVNAHDGSSAFRVLRTTVRVVCNNTLTVALRAGASSGVSVRHTGQLLRRVEQARRVLSVAELDFQRHGRHINRLAKTPVSARQVRDYALYVRPDPRDADPSRARADRELIEANFEAPEQRLPGITGSAWALYNAASAWADHQRPVRGISDTARDTNRLASTWLGDSAELKRKAFGRALELAGVN